MTRARDLASLGNQSAIAVDSSANVGIGSTIPDAKLDVVGVVSATTLYGDGSNLTSVTASTATTATSAATAYGLTGNVGSISAGAVTCGAITADSLTASGNVSIAGTLTYEDVTSVDSIGIATARTGLRVTAGGIVVTAGVSTFAAAIDANSNLDLAGKLDVDGHTELDNVNVAGVTTATTLNITTLNSDSLVGSAITISDKKFSSNKTLQERTKISSTAFDNGTASSLLVNVDEGMVHYRSSNLNSASTVPNIMSTVGINTLMGLGDALTVTLISNVSSTSNFINAITIEGQAVTETWVGGSAPTEGGGSNYDVYTFNIIKKGTSGTYNSDFIVLGNHILYSG